MAQIALSYVVRIMLKRLLILTFAVLPWLHGVAQAQGQRLYQSAELEALLAPVALYPDALLNDILTAATHAADVIEAARQPQAANPYWHPSVQSLLAYPEILENMASSPAWMLDVGTAYLGQPRQVSEAVQLLRQRARAAGSVQGSGPQVVYVPYPAPVVVYGAWTPIFIASPPVFVSKHFHAHRNGPPSPAARLQARNFAHRQQGVGVTPFVRVPEASRQPIVQSHSAPAAQMQRHPQRRQ
jgi:hypothetical protein